MRSPAAVLPQVVNIQQSRALDQRIADRALHHDRPLSLSRQRDKESTSSEATVRGLPEYSSFGSRGRAAAVLAALFARRGAADTMSRRRNISPMTARPWSPSR